MSSVLRTTISCTLIVVVLGEEVSYLWHFTLAGSGTEFQKRTKSHIIYKSHITNNHKSHIIPDFSICSVNLLFFFFFCLSGFQLSNLKKWRNYNSPQMVGVRTNQGSGNNPTQCAQRAAPVLTVACWTVDLLSYVNKKQPSPSVPRPRQNSLNGSCGISYLNWQQEFKSFPAQYYSVRNNLSLSHSIPIFLDIDSDG